MSLLMDALKKAELAKRQGGADDATGPHGSSALSLEPLPAVMPANSEVETVPDPQASLSLASHLEELDARFLEEVTAAARQVPPPVNLPREDAPQAVAPPPPPEPAGRIEPSSAPPPRTAGEPQAAAAARNVFAAKQPEKADNRKGFAIAVGMLTVVAVIAIGGYFWWQLQPKGPMAIARSAPPPAAPPPAPAPASAPIAASPAPTPAATPAAPPVAPAAGAQTPVAPAQASGPSRAAKAARIDDEHDGPPATRSRAAPKAATRPADTGDEEAPIRVTRNPLKVDPALARGFDALGRGELTLAQLEYERARKNDPRNTDALHGLATIAQRQGRIDLAEAYYRQIVELDPQDPLAISALLNQRGQVDPGGTESRLKSLAAGQPDLAAPQFALGNLYAKQGRWNDAQQAYFRAYNAEPENPDILFNLAVSLEHLRQNKLAIQYYQQAIAAAASRPAGFDRERAVARLKTLQN